MYLEYIKQIGKKDNNANQQYYSAHKLAIDKLMQMNQKPNKKAIKALEQEMKPALTEQEFQTLCINNELPKFEGVLNQWEKQLSNHFSKEKIRLLDNGVDYFYTCYHTVFSMFGYNKYKTNVVDTYEQQYNLKQVNTSKVLQKTLDKRFKQWKTEHSFLYFLQQLRLNQHYSDSYEQISQEITILANLKEEILNAIPDNYIDLYPETRNMQRKFVLHIGPTNSGKTYDAIQSLMQATNGVYLAPLRLLAYEQFDNLNKQGVLCSLLTGEEQITIPFAMHIASTIEMANLSTVYEVAVIDEGQMIADFDRGSSWTKAIVGLQAKEIHICCANYAKDILIKLIEECNDIYELIYNERKTPLQIDYKTFSFPKSVKKGDALIVFSRKSVHSVANELTKYKIKCSIIYGALPYDVRHKEAEKFANGDTEVVVATDAIGMGLNLPIQRVVFLEESKFDGFDFRYLHPEEMQQIAGRAGRFGIYDVGFVNGFDHYFLKNNLNEKISSIESCYISFVPSLITLNVKLSSIIKKWEQIKSKNDLFVKTDTQRMIELCKILEAITDSYSYETKKKIYDLITIPFDDKLLDLWKHIAKKILHNQPIDLNTHLPSYNNKNMEKLEFAYKQCDLLYNFAYKFAIKDFDNKQFLQDVFDYKRKISDCIIKLLDKRTYSVKQCSRCGCTLPFNYRYGICQDCYQYNYYDAWE